MQLSLWSHLWHIARLVGLRAIHPCAQWAFCSSPFKCFHIQGRVIYSKEPLHIWWCMSVFHFYSCQMTLCGWLWRLDEVARVWQRGGGAELGAREEWLCVTATDSEMVVGRVEVVRLQGTETIKEWSYWWLKGNSIRNNSALIRKRSVNWNYRQTDRP